MMRILPRPSITSTLNRFQKITWTSQKNFRTSVIASESFNVQDEADFETRVLKSERPVIVDFHARWCGPCRLLTPRLETLATEKLDKFHLAKVDIDNIPELAEEYNVNAVPYVLALKGGKVQGSFVGVLDDDKLKAFVNKLVEE